MYLPVILMAILTISYASASDFEKVYQALKETADDKTGCEIIQKYLDTRGDVNQRRVNYRQTLLHATVNSVLKPKAMELLLKNNADPNVSDREGCSPLDEVVDADSVDLSAVKILLRYNADVNYQSKERNRAATLSKVLSRREHARKYARIPLYGQGCRLLRDPSDELIVMLLESTAYGRCAPHVRDNPRIMDFFQTRAEKYIRQATLLPITAVQLVFDFFQEIS